MISFTSKFIEKITNELNELVDCYYIEAPKTCKFPYAVVNNLHISSLSTGDLINLDIDIWADDKKETAIEELEEKCDLLRNKLDGKIINEKDKFSCTLFFENQSVVRDSDVDLLHRNLSFTARIFYIGG